MRYRKKDQVVVTLLQLLDWVRANRFNSDLVYASCELGIDMQGKSDKELLRSLVETICKEIVSRGPHAEAKVSVEFADYVKRTLRPNKQQQQQAPSTKVA